jgi:hypothetical protein
MSRSSELKSNVRGAREKLAKKENQ